jgi:hypothetical protein
MTADQIDKAAEMFKRGVRVGNIAKRLGTDAKEIRKALRSRGLMFLTPPPATLVLKSVPRWCVDRLTVGRRAPADGWR